ncbi:MAG: APC family permease [Candidatus Binataceae bacterium]
MKEETPVQSARLGGRGRNLGLLSLIAVMYLVVSGGAYGLEDAVRIAGPNLTLLLCALVPLSLSLPTALMAAELTALMPTEGGFYFWVKEGFGPWAGFIEAYLTILYTAVDMAIYPLLFASYLSFVVPMGATGQVIAGIALIWLSGLLNIMGVRPVGRASIVLTIILLAPFVGFVIAGLPRLIHFVPPSQPMMTKDFLGALGGGLTVVIWNFGGWENLSVVAGEIEQPRRNYLRAVLIAVPLVALGYLLPLGVALSGATHTGGWRLGWFAHEGYRIGGAPLGLALGVGGAVCGFAVFEAAMLWVSRMPYVLASEGYLPPVLAEIWLGAATPVKSILLCCAVFTLLLPLGFVVLVVLDVFFYMGALTLEMGALLRLRRLRPHREGLFMIGGGRIALYAIVAAPLLTWFATFGLALSAGTSKRDFILAIALALLAWPAYRWCRYRYGGPSPVVAASSIP